MSITESFETREHNRNGWIVYFPYDVEQLLYHARSLEAQNEELKAMLRKHQWTDGTSEYCPECHRWDAYGHSPDCALAKLIGE